jgi:plasmid stabilization system protein ParE
VGTWRLTRRARRSLAEIWEYIALDSENAADHVIDELVEAFGSLGRNPHIGRSREDLRSGCRTFLAGIYVIIYRVGQDEIVILDTIDGKRDVPGAMNG